MEKSVMMSIGGLWMRVSEFRNAITNRFIGRSFTKREKDLLDEIYTILWWLEDGEGK